MSLLVQPDCTSQKQDARSDYINLLNTQSIILHHHHHHHRH